MPFNPESSASIHAMPKGVLPSSEWAMLDFFSYCKKFNPKDFETILCESQLVRFQSGDCIYRQGEKSDSFYVLNEGSVEIIVAGEHGENPIPIVYLTKGDLFGELGLLTGLPRNGTAWVPEIAEALKFTKSGFERLIFAVPSFAFYISCLLARRLQQTTAQLHFYSNSRELAGSLDFFDLPTIFQTISLSQQHGALEIRQVAGDVIGEFVFAFGRPIKARFKQLEGLDALYEFFQSAPRGTFTFASTTEPPVVDAAIQVADVNQFLMDAVHQRDELKVLQEKLELEKPLGRVHGQFQWPADDPLEGCARQIFETLVDRSLSPLDLFEQLPYTQYGICQALVRLIEMGLITPAKITPYGYRV